MKKLTEKFEEILGEHEEGCGSDVENLYSCDCSRPAQIEELIQAVRERDKEILKLECLQAIAQKEEVRIRMEELL